MEKLIISERCELDEQRQGIEYWADSEAGAKCYATAWQSFDDTYMVIETLEGERVAHKAPGEDWINDRGEPSLTPAERKRKERADKRASGLVSVTVWIKKGREEELRTAAKHINLQPGPPVQD